MTHHTRQSALGLPLIVHRQYGEAEFDVSEYTMSEIKTFSDGREMTAFIAELTARLRTSRFMSTFGSESYYARNSAVLAGSAQQSLIARMDELDLEAIEEAAAAEAAKVKVSAGCGGCHGC